MSPFCSFLLFLDIISLYMSFALLLKNEGLAAYKLFEHAIVYVKMFYKYLMH